MSYRRGPRQIAVWRAGLSTVGLGALICGYLGMHQYLSGTDKPHGPADLLYYTIQLFVLSSPPIDGHTGHLPVLLHIARFAAPAVTAYAVLEAGRRLFASELALLRIRRTRHHHVVCGDGPIADALAGRLVTGGSRVVRIPGRDGVELGRRQMAVDGDPASAAVLRAAGVDRAEVLYVCTRDSAANLAVLLATSTLVRRGRHPLEVHVQVDDPELCLAMQARRLDMPESAALRVSFFSAHETAARKLLSQHWPPVAVDRPPRYMIVGASDFGCALAVELARHWRVYGDPSHRAEIAIVDIDADGVIDRLARRYPFLADVCCLSAQPVAIENMLDGDLDDVPPDRVYICGDDEEVALRIALTMDYFWRREQRSLVVRLSRLGLLGQAFHATGDARLLDDIAGTLVLFDAVEAGSDPNMVDDSLVERLGRAIHENYLALRLDEGVDFQSTPAMQPWSRLPDRLKDANRAQAADVGNKLRAIGCVLAPSPVWGRPERLDDAVIEKLARMEHQRWYDYMTAGGWQYGEKWSEEGQAHPDLVDWEQLRERSRDSNREAVREIPAFLSDAGFQIVRLPSLAPQGTPNGSRRPAIPR